MLRVRCKQCGVELTSTNKTQACGCSNQMELIESKISAVDLSQVMIVKMWVDEEDKTSFSKVEDDYRKIIDELIMDRFVDFGPGVDTETAIINIKETFDIYRGQPWVATSKLQQLRFLYALMTLPPKKRDDFCTSLIFTAEKAGKRYGPYGKLY